MSASSFCRAALALLLSIALGGCAGLGANGAATTTPTALKLEDPTPAVSPIVPPTADQPPAATPPPTPLADIRAPATASALVGPEWTIAAQGDVNGDGRPDVIAYKPAGIAPRQPNPDFPATATEIVIVQLGASGAPEIQLAVSPQQVVNTRQQLVAYPQGAAPAAFLARVGGQAPLSIIPLSASGDAYGIGSGFVWDAATASYQPSPLPQGQLAGASPPQAPALVGPEWTIAAQGDINGNGRRDVVAYKPASLTPQRPDPAFPTLAGEVVIVEEGLLGSPEIQFALNPRQITAPGTVLATYPGDRPAAGFLVSLNAGINPVSFVPLDSSGATIAQGGRIVWSAEAQGFRLSSDSRPVPVPRPLVGPEWSIIAEGDANADGRRDVIAYKPAGIAPRQPSAAYPYAAVEVVIVQQNASGPYGDPEVQLAINTQQIFAPGVSLFNYATSDPTRVVAAFQLNVQPGSGVPVSVIPINSAGDTIPGLSVGATWERSVQAYRLVPGGGPTTRPPSQPPVKAGASPLVGPEWTIYREGDHNADGRRDVIAYKPAAVPRPADPSFALIASELVIVQANASDQPELLLAVTPQQIIAPGAQIASFATSDPARAVALFQANAGSAGSLDLIALNANGDAVSQRLTIAWSVGQQGYRLASPAPPPPPPPGPQPAQPLVGPEWTVIVEGDANADGRRDVIAYKPAATQPAAFDPDYPLTVSEAVVVQANAAGQPELLLAISPSQITVPGGVLVDFARLPASAVAAFQMQVRPGSGVPIDLRGINASGATVGQGFGVSWDRGQGRFTLVGAPAPAPTPSPAASQSTAAPQSAAAPPLGPEWSVAASGDANRDGIPDTIAYKPAQVAPAQADPALQIVAAEVAIVQSDASGQPQTLLLITPQSITTPALELASFPAGSVAAFQLGIAPGSDVPLTVAPLDASGQPTGQRIGLMWSDGQQGYRLAPGR